MKKAEFLEFKAKIEANGVKMADEKLKAPGEGHLNKKEWIKDKQNRTYYRLNGLYDAGYCDNVKKKYIPGDDFDIELGLSFI